MKRPSHPFIPLAMAGLLVLSLVGVSFGEPAEADQQNAVPGQQEATPGVPCAKREDVVRILRESFGEHPVGHGLATTGAMAELFSSASGSWTIVATSPSGMSCMVGSGESWQTVVAREDTI
jgi:hypothetical protein